MRIRNLKRNCAVYIMTLRKNFISNSNGMKCTAPNTLKIPQGNGNENRKNKTKRNDKHCSGQTGSQKRRRTLVPLCRVRRSSELFVGTCNSWRCQSRATHSLQTTTLCQRIHHQE